MISEPCTSATIMRLSHTAKSKLRLHRKTSTKNFFKILPIFPNTQRKTSRTARLYCLVLIRHANTSRTCCLVLIRHTNTRHTFCLVLIPHTNIIHTFSGAKYEEILPPSGTKFPNGESRKLGASGR